MGINIVIGVPNVKSSESNPSSCLCSYSWTPTESKTTPSPLPRAPHSQPVSYNQCAYEHPKENKFTSSKNNLGSYNHHPSHSKPDFSSKTKYHPMLKHDADLPSSTSRYFHSFSTTHPQITPSTRAAEPLHRHNTSPSWLLHLHSLLTSNPWPAGSWYDHTMASTRTPLTYHLSDCTLHPKRTRILLLPLHQNERRIPPQPPIIPAPLHNLGHETWFASADTRKESRSMCYRRFRHCFPNSLQYVNNHFWKGEWHLLHVHTIPNAATNKSAAKCALWNKDAQRTQDESIENKILQV